MATATNIDIKQKLSSSHANRLNVNSNHLKFGERIDISANSTPIKTFSNHSFSSIDLTIFPETKLQFNVPTVKVTFLPSFKPKVTHNISSYQ
jgi:hypothetical protein